MSEQKLPIGWLIKHIWLPDLGMLLLFLFIILLAVGFVVSSFDSFRDDKAKEVTVSKLCAVHDQVSVEWCVDNGYYSFE